MPPAFCDRRQGLWNESARSFEKTLELVGPVNEVADVNERISRRVR